MASAAGKRQRSRPESLGWRALRASRARGAQALRLWHLSSLDAPTVALVWAETLACSTGAGVRPREAAVLALGTWIVYVLDRVADGVGLRGEAAGASGAPVERGRPLKDRHWFHRRHRAPLLTLCALGALVLAWLCQGLPPRLLWTYLALGVPVSAYAIRVHATTLFGRRGHTGLGSLAKDRSTERGTERSAGPGSRNSRKEAAVAILFTAATAAPALEFAPRQALPGLAADTALLAALCWLNCVFISHAERGDPRPDPVQHRRLVRCSLALAAIAALVCACTATWGRPSSVAPAAAVLAASLLLWTLLGRLARQESPLRLRILADLVLLTPVAFLLVRR